MNLTHIAESFINFVGNTGCTDCFEDELCGCYPISSFNDLRFQILLEVGEDDPDAAGLEAGTVTFHLGVANTCDECASDDIKLAQMHGEWWKASGSDQQDYYVLSVDTIASASLIDRFEDGECFVLCLYVKGKVGQLTEYEKLGCSDCFIRVTETCDTSVIKYRQNETSMGFYNNGLSFYDTYFNSIRLPIKLARPQIKSKKNVYRLSNGNYIKNSATLAKEWDCETDMINRQWHEKLSIALEHDQVKLTNENAGITDAFVQSEAEDNYKVNWDDFLDYPNAKAEFKLLEMPFNEFNNNCNLTPLDPNTNVNVIASDAYNLLSWE